jgi:4-amino-4-deoxy-L-arabinose transferase-like glycosyltransferase
MFKHRRFHYSLIVGVAAILHFPNLGAHSLWDVDECINAEAGREMYVSGDWVVPRFNFRLRDAKPAMLYWLQSMAYAAFGVNEFAARFPSALAGTIAMLLVYELGRRLFSAATGCLASIIFGSAVLVCVIHHAATPDAILLCSIVLVMLAFWSGYAPESGDGPPRRSWYVPVGAACGLATLAKGPIGVVLPVAVIGTFLLWQRQLKSLVDRRLFRGIGAFLIVAAPWYVAVTAETQGAWTRGFLMTNNVRRFLEPMEHHRGPLYFYPLSIAAGFFPWSVFLIPALVRGGRMCWRRWAVTDDRLVAESLFRPEGEPELGRAPAYRFLFCWAVVYLTFFSAASTKLPNYVLPLYPALALLTARMLVRWQARRVALSGWLMPASLSLLAISGAGVAAGFLIAGGVIALPGVSVPPMPGLGRLAGLGIIPIAGAIVASLYLMLQRRSALVMTTAATAVAFAGVLAALAGVALDDYKDPRRMIETAGACRPDQDIRIASYRFTRPSLVFYCGREVWNLADESHVIEFLGRPRPSYLFVPETDWHQIRSRHSLRNPVVARQWDLLLKNHVVVIGTHHEGAE